MKTTKAKRVPILKRFKNWITHHMTCLSNWANTMRRQENTSSQTSSPEVTAMESSESSSCSSEESAPSEPGCPHNRSLMSCLQASSSRTQSVSAELAATSKIPCSAAHPLPFTYNLVHSTQNPNPGRSEHVGDRESIILVSRVPVSGRWGSLPWNQTRTPVPPSADKVITDSLASQDKQSGSSSRSSDELPVEGDMCRICQSSESSPDNQLLSPCNCSGSMKFVHLNCLQKWLHIRIESGLSLSDAKVCELCKGSLMLDPDTFDWVAFYLAHQQQEEDDQVEVDDLLMRWIIGNFITNLHRPNHRGETMASELLVVFERNHRPQRPSDSEPSA